MREVAELKRFQPRHFREYQQWFTEDTQLEQYLGPLDEEWLQHVLHEQDGYQYAWEQEGQLLAVAGILLPTTARPYYVLTDIGINPKLRRFGYGRKLLRTLTRVHPPANSIYWLTYVDRSNINAQRFFKNQDWSEVEKQSSVDLVAYRYPTAST